MVKRVKGVHTIYFGSDYEIRDGAATIFVPVGDKRIAAWVQRNHIVRDLYDDVAPLGEKRGVHIRAKDRGIRCLGVLRLETWDVRCTFIES